MPHFRVAQRFYWGFKSSGTAFVWFSTFRRNFVKCLTLPTNVQNLPPQRHMIWPYVWVIMIRRNMTVTAPTQETNSYRKPGTFLPVILERMIGIRRNLLREQRYTSRCCASVINRRLNRCLWVVLVFNAQVFAALQDGIISQNLWPPRSPDFDISGFLSLGLPEEESLQGGGGNLAPQKPWKTTSDWTSPTLRKIFCGERWKTCNVGFGCV